MREASYWTFGKNFSIIKKFSTAFALIFMEIFSNRHKIYKF